MATLNKTPFPLSVSLHTLDSNQGPDIVKLLAGSSVKSLELWGPTFEKSESSVRNMRQALTAVGIEARTVHANFGSSMDLSSPDRSIREAGTNTFQTALDLAVRMDAKIIIVHPSSEPITNNARLERMKLAKGSIEALAEMAHQADCRIAIELLPRTCLGRSAEELLQLIEGVDAAGACLDTNHLMGDYALLPEAVHELGSRLIALHCSDYDGTDERHWPPLRGVIDWGQFLSALRDIGFSGPFNYEATLDGENPKERLACLEENYFRLPAAD